MPGEDNETVLLRLGYSVDDISNLKAQGVLI